MLSHFGFSSSVFIKVDSNRINITEDEIRTGTFEPADAQIKQALNELFETNRFSSLKRLKNSNAESDALVLIDEAEMALHPRVQKRLLDYLRRIVTEKHITVFISTHSITMIKAIPKSNILLLESEGSGRYHIYLTMLSSKSN